MIAALTSRDVVFAIATIVEAVAIVGIIGLLLWLTEPDADVEPHEAHCTLEHDPAHMAEPVEYVRLIEPAESPAVTPGR